MTESSLMAALIVQRKAAPRVANDRIRLLRATDAQGPIAGAAPVVGLSCGAAWDAVGPLNTRFARPLVKAAPGGAQAAGCE